MWCLKKIEILTILSCDSLQLLVLTQIGNFFHWNRILNPPILHLLVYCSLHSTCRICSTGRDNNRIKTSLTQLGVKIKSCWRNQQHLLQRNRHRIGGCCVVKLMILPQSAGSKQDSTKTRRNFCPRLWKVFWSLCIALMSSGLSSWASFWSFWQQSLRIKKMHIASRHDQDQNDVNWRSRVYILGPHIIAH